jgi:hypothetical protein
MKLGIHSTFVNIYIYVLVTNNAVNTLNIILNTCVCVCEPLQFEIIQALNNNIIIDIHICYVILLNGTVISLHNLFESYNMYKFVNEYAAFRIGHRSSKDRII